MARFVKVATTDELQDQEATRGEVDAGAEQRFDCHIG